VLARAAGDDVLDARVGRAHEEVRLPPVSPEGGGEEKGRTRMSPTNSTSSSCAPDIMPAPMLAAKMTRRSTISHSSIAGTKRCGCSALRRKAFQTCA
jgi:hypothetical protein